MHPKLLSCWVNFRQQFKTTRHSCVLTFLFSHFEKVSWEKGRLLSGALLLERETGWMHQRVTLRAAKVYFNFKIYFNIKVYFNFKVYFNIKVYFSFKV